MNPAVFIPRKKKTGKALTKQGSAQVALKVNPMPKIPKKKKEKSQEWYRKKCVAKAKELAKKRDGYKCQYDGCGKSKANGWQMHGSHCYGEGSNKRMSADVDNIITLCATHHVGGMWKNAKEPSWHEDPLTMSEWFRNKYPELAATLKERVRKQHEEVLPAINWEKKWQEMKDMCITK